MGIFTRSRTQKRIEQVQAAQRLTAGYVDPSTFPIASPWATSDLHRVVFQDIFGSDVPDNSRAAAMRLPALARARNLMVSTIARLPLQQLTGVTVMPETDQPAWLSRTGDGSSPQLRMAWTVDDLIFYGWSCWWRENDGDDLAAARRLNQDEWTINDDMRVVVNGSPVSESDVIVIPGLHEGILSYAADVIDDSRTLYRNVRARLLNPVPHLNLHQTEGEPLTDTQIDALIARWATARQGKNGGVSFTNQAIEVDELGAGSDAQLMIDARNAAAVDQARVVGVSAGRVDASGVNSTLTYETREGRNQELIDVDLALYLTPISARLSLDDVTPAGRRVDFDLANLTSLTPGTGPNFRD